MYFRHTAKFRVLAFSGQNLFGPLVAEVAKTFGDPTWEDAENLGEFRYGTPFPQQPLTASLASRSRFNRRNDENNNPPINDRTASAINVVRGCYCDRVIGGGFIGLYEITITGN
ncbi:hypothetical protein [Rubripirellula obstinata]|uniref:hypothetical protein n=1 Tax=Rubripirellula obstinata TaxID=406547 RepID=UPI00122C206D|nr:hypothetical protein [Rubripirellula obstinata]